MFEPKKESPYLLIGKYIQGTISSEETDILLSYMKENFEIAKILYKNIQADFWLQTIFQAEREVEDIPFSPLPEDLKENVSNTDPQSEILKLLEKALVYEKNAVPVPKDREEKDYKILEVRSNAPVIARKNIDQSKSNSNQEPKRMETVFRLILSLGLLFGLFGWLSFDHYRQTHKQPEDTFRPLVKIEEVVDPVWKPGSPQYKRGQGIGPNKLFLESGLARIRFKNGADLILEGPAEFVVNGPMNSFCDKGKISARIPKEAVGFEIVTPFATVIDRGTEFFLEVNEKKAEVSVIKGQVDFTPPNEAVQTLTEKMASIIDLSTKRSAISFDPRDYYTPKKFESACQDYSNRVAQKENVIISALNNRIDLLARYDFNQKELGAVLNAASGPKSIKGSASVFSSISCEGTRYGTWAALLNGEQSRIDLPASGTCQDLTLFLTVRPDKLDQAGSILLSTEEGENATSFVLQIFYNGALKFWINQSGGLDYQEFVSSPFFFKTNYGTWYDLAVVTDSRSKKISLYADGEMLTEGPCPDLKPMNLRSITIGNSSLKATKGKTRFSGAVGEFMIFNSPLSQEELQQIRK